MYNPLNTWTNPAILDVMLDNDELWYFHNNSCATLVNDCALMDC